MIWRAARGPAYRVRHGRRCRAHPRHDRRLSRRGRCRHRGRSVRLGIPARAGPPGGNRPPGRHTRRRCAAAVDPADDDEVRVLTGRLAERAGADAEFAALLCGWAERHAPTLRAERSEVHNTVSEGAHITGPVVQARDIHGDLNFG
ncbi:hypothetical protein ACWV95_09350 [Streptomyces albus]